MWWLVVAITSLAPTGCNAQSAVREKAIMLWHVSATDGPVVTYVTNKAVKVCFGNINGYLLSTAPNWAVVLVNVDEKLCYKATLDLWLKHEIRRTYIGTLDDQGVFQCPVKRLGSARYAGISCIKYGIPLQQQKLFVSRADYFVLEPHQLPLQACLILDKWFTTPKLHAVPLALKWINPETGEYCRSQMFRQRATSGLYGGYVDNLDCQKVSQIECEPDFFRCPKDLRQVPAEVDVFSSQKQKRMVEEMLLDPHAKSAKH